METIKFSDFMAKKHEIIGLTAKEEEIASCFKYLALVLLIMMGAFKLFPELANLPVGLKNVEHAFLYK